MAVVGDDFILNCRECFSAHGYGIRLQSFGSNMYRCSKDGSHQYTVEAGFLKRLH